jgi:hypothetical protein
MHIEHAELPIRVLCPSAFVTVEISVTFPSAGETRVQVPEEFPDAEEPEKLPASRE